MLNVSVTLHIVKVLSKLNRESFKFKEKAYL